MKLSLPHAFEPCLHHRSSFCVPHNKWNYHCQCGKTKAHRIHSAPKEWPVGQTAGRGGVKRPKKLNLREEEQRARLWNANHPVGTPGEEVLRLKLAVTGSRTWVNRSLLRAVLSHLHYEYNITLLIHGGALGADMFADQWAEDCLIERKTVLPDYGTYGRYEAPKVRNSEIVALSDAVVAFRAAGKSGGTDDCKGKAEKVGKLWLVISDWREVTP